MDITREQDVSRARTQSAPVMGSVYSTAGNAPSLAQRYLPSSTSLVKYRVLMFHLLKNDYILQNERFLLDPVRERHANWFRAEFPAKIHPEHAAHPRFFFLEILDIENL